MGKETVDPVIRFDKVFKVYSGDYVALEDVNFDIFPGDFVSLIGHSGAGKSTLLKMIYAEEKPDEGVVLFNGDDISQLKRKFVPYYRRNIGTVFQEFRLLPHKTVFENIAYALEVIGKTNEEIETDIPEILNLVSLTEHANKYPEQLSGGEQQRVSLARALVHNPLIVVADEPTGNLDPDSSLEIMDLLTKINDMGTTIILATHDKDIVDKVGRRVVVLEKGKLVRDDANGKYKK
ncbi:cell division ATP-binding protein FtsE [Patescibacteria group bacterium]